MMTMNELVDVTGAVKGTPVSTFADLARAQGWYDWPDKAVDLLRRETAGQRHTQRVDRCLRVAEVVAKTVDPSGIYEALLARVLLEIGWRGVGGPRDLGAIVPGGDRTSARIWPWSEVCGKGRAQASDGLVWCVALEAAQAVYPSSPGLSVTGDLHPSDLLFVLGMFKKWALNLPEGQREVGLKWVEDLFDGGRALAGRRLLNREGVMRDWAEVYSILHHALTPQEIKQHMRWMANSYKPLLSAEEMPPLPEWLRDVEDSMIEEVRITQWEVADGESEEGNNDADGGSQVVGCSCSRCSRVV